MPPGAYVNPRCRLARGKVATIFHKISRNPLSPLPHAHFLGGRTSPAFPGQGTSPLHGKIPPFPGSYSPFPSMPSDSDSPRELLVPRRHFFSAEERQMDRLVAQWVGEESAPDILGRFHPQPRPLGKCAEGFLRKIGQDQGVLLEKICGHWPQVVGEQTSRQLRPVEVRGDTLVVSAENPTYLYVFRQSPLMGTICQRLEQLTEGRVKQCRLVAPGRR